MTLPATSDPGYRTALDAAAAESRADLVIACRDPDAIVVAEANDDPSSPVTAPMPPAGLVRMTRDKYDTFLWCVQHGVPFVPTVPTASATAVEECAALVVEWGYPLIAKPRDGSGSLGVRVLTEPRHLKAACGAPDLVVQPYLGPPPAQQLELDTALGIPLFFEVPVPDGAIVMTVIGKSGDVGPICHHSMELRLGRIERFELLHDEALTQMGAEAVGRFRDEGWRGPLNLQVRRGKDGWRVIEVNPRFAGGTSGRLHLGYDEVGRAVNDWLGRQVVPAYRGPVVQRVTRYLTDHVER